MRGDENMKDNYSEIKKSDLRPLSNKERWEIYAKLTKDQRLVLDAHRKYLVRSEFVKNSYLEASDWQFLDLKVDARYPEKYEEKYMLFCECGRRLKYQYIVVSKQTGKQIKLGRQHFKDHLNLPSHVASEINQKINNVDYALDELLWLIRKEQTFPNQLWRKLMPLLYKKQQLNKFGTLNREFLLRMIDFENVNLPVYFSDYEYLKKLTQRQGNELPVTSEAAKKYFVDHLEDYIDSESLKSQTAFWAVQIQERLAHSKEEPQMPKKYFEELHSILCQFDTISFSKIETQLMRFAKRGMGKWIQEDVYNQMLAALNALGYTTDFLQVIHPFMSDGLQGFAVQDTNAPDVIIETVLPKQKNENQVEKTSHKIYAELSHFDEGTQLDILKHLEQLISKQKKKIK